MSTLLTINSVFYLIGFIVMLLVGMTLRDKGNPKRLTTALFWFLFGSVFLFSDLMVATLGKPMAYRIVGVIVLLIAAPALVRWLFRLPDVRALAANTRKGNADEHK